MLVNITYNQFKIIVASSEIALDRKDDKSIFINASSISKVTGLTWKTVNTNLLKLKNIKGL